MSLRYLAGFITASYNPLKVPNAPTLGTVTPASGQVTVAFTAPSNVGGSAITSYIAIVQDTSTGVGITATGSASPITVTGLTNGQTYNVKVAAVNQFGPSPYSAPSGDFIWAFQLYGWGINTNGNLGLNDTANRSSPVQVGSANAFTAITIREGAFAIKENNTLWGWGNNLNGGLGLNDTINRSSPVQIGALTNWKSISSNANSPNCVAAVKTDGTLWAWGDNVSGGVGDNTTVPRSSPVQIGALTTWSKTTAANDFVLAIKTDGTLWAWGYNAYGTVGDGTIINRSSPVQVGALTNWVEVAAGNFHTLAVKTDGTLWAWGRNNNGQLGLNLGTATSNNRSSPVQVGTLTNWKSISSSNRTAIATKTDNTLWAWGLNDNGQIGDGTVAQRSSPVQVGALTTWIEAKSCGQSALARQTNGTLWTWGFNGDGNLAQNDLVYRSSPVQVGSNTTWASLPSISGNNALNIFAISNP